MDTEGPHRNGRHLGKQLRRTPKSSGPQVPYPDPMDALSLWWKAHRRIYLCFRPLMLFDAYIDDSTDRFRKQVIVSAAVLGRKQTWDDVSRRWKGRLAADEIEYFKSSDCESLNGQFHKFANWGRSRERLRQH